MIVDAAFVRAAFDALKEFNVTDINFWLTPIDDKIHLGVKLMHNGEDLTREYEVPHRIHSFHYVADLYNKLAAEFKVELPSEDLTP